jgi:GTPase
MAVVPTVAIIGRPNVGKSTLLNRIVGRREAIVEERPGVTRDRKIVDAEWQGNEFQLVDTGGWIPGGSSLDEKVSRQSEKAIANADAVIFVVDITTGITEEDDRVAALLRGHNRPVFVVANKVDDPVREALMWDFLSLGLGNPWPVSALHGAGTGDLLDGLVAALPDPEPVIDDAPTADAEDAPKIFGVALVGRPNVGKSTLVNRILGSRQAVVEDVPGVTRDRVTYDALWNGRAFTLVDTGGWEPSIEGTESLAARVAGQARVAVDAADAVLFVVDATVGATDADDAVADVLRRSGVPVVVAANKVDNAATELTASALWSLGLGEPRPVSALHGRGSGDLLDAVLDALPETPPQPHTAPSGPRRVALLGKPNVGKSSLLNKLAGEQRVLVDDVAGTTRDPVDELIELGGKTWRFVDTAGIRRRFRESQGADYYAALRTAGALEVAEVAVVLVDASEPLTEQDLRIISMVIEAGRSLVIAFNKWDLVDEERRHYLEREIDRQLYNARWAPRVNISATTGRHVERLVPAIETALAGWETRISTGRLNAWLNGLIAATPPPVRGGRQPKVLFATQAGIRPPHVVLFTTRFLEASYRRFVERKLREEFGFDGSPLKVSMRIREKRGRNAGSRGSSASRH